MSKEEKLEIALSTYKQLCEIHLKLVIDKSKKNNLDTINRVHNEIKRLLEEV